MSVAWLCTSDGVLLLLLLLWLLLGLLLGLRLVGCWGSVSLLSSLGKHEKTVGGVVVVGVKSSFGFRLDSHAVAHFLGSGSYRNLALFAGLCCRCVHSSTMEIQSVRGRTSTSQLGI